MPALVRKSPRHLDIPPVVVDMDAGYGNAANEVFAPKREAIAKAYPGMADQLVARIKRRAEMEKMPLELVKRIDELNAAVGVSAEPAA